MIELEHVSRYYERPEGGDSRQVLKDISFAVKAGDSVAIIGPSGSGKSTLLNMIGGLDRPSGGKVLFEGKDIWQMDEKQLATFRNRHIGFVFQMHHLLPQLNLMENVMLPMIPLKDKARMASGRNRALELIEKVGLKDRMLQRPGQMSVGECQRAAVVRALINEPDFILADEPTGSLDQQSAETLGELLAGLPEKRKIGLVVVTHSEKLAHKLNTVMRLEEGMLLPYDRTTKIRKV